MVARRRAARARVSRASRGCRAAAARRLRERSRTRRASEEDGPPTLPAPSIPAVVALSAWVVFCWFVTRHPLPNTFYAKHDHRDVLGNLRRSMDAIWFDAPTGALGGASVLCQSSERLTLVRSLRAPCAAVARRAVALHRGRRGDAAHSARGGSLLLLSPLLGSGAAGRAASDRAGDRRPWGAGSKPTGRAVGKLGSCIFRAVGKVDDGPVRVGVLHAVPGRATPSSSTAIRGTAGTSTTCRCESAPLSRLACPLSRRSSRTTPARSATSAIERRSTCSA